MPLSLYCSINLFHIRLPGPQVLFVTMPEAIAYMWGGASLLILWCFLVFNVIVVCLVSTSVELLLWVHFVFLAQAYPTVVFIDCFMTGFYDDLIQKFFPYKFAARLILSAIFCFASFLLSLPFARRVSVLRNETISLFYFCYAL